MGNSEVGHTNIGAGRVVFQDLPKISHAIEDGTFFENSAYLEAIQACKETGSALHLMGLLSDGGVHSHITHLYALLELAKRHGLEQLYIHVFLDGRDVSPTSGRDYVRQLQEKIQALGIGQIADVMGRYYAMDRDSRWNRLQRAYDAMVNGTGHFFDDPLEAIQSSYDEGITDEFMEPVICTREGRLNAGDGVIFYNFRPDRARELTRALVDPDFDKLKRKRGFLPCLSSAPQSTTPPCPTSPWPSPREAEKYLRRVSQQTGPDPASHCGDGKICPCDLLLQWRSGGGLPRGGPLPHPLPQGSHL